MPWSIGTKARYRPYFNFSGFKVDLSAHVTLLIGPSLSCSVI